MTGPQPPYGGQGGQWPAGGDWQAPSDQTQYGGPSAPGGYEQPQSYEQFEQPQAYDQYAQQPGYPDQYSAPPAGYPEPYSGPPGYTAPAPPMPGVPPPVPKQSNPLPWVLGGIAGVIVLVLVIIVAAVVFTSGGGGGDGGPGGGGDDGGDSGKYTAANVKNACDLVDTTVLKQWADSKDRGPENDENRSDYSSMLNCNASYKGSGDDYRSATMYMSATVGEYVKDSYASAEKIAKGSTGSGKENGDVSGIGEDAYFASEVDETEYSKSIRYQLGALDGNLTFRIEIWVFGDARADVSKDDLAKVCEEQARKLMEKLTA